MYHKNVISPLVLIWRLKRYQMRDYFHSKMLHLKGEIKNKEKALIPLGTQRFLHFYGE